MFLSFFNTAYCCLVPLLLITLLLWKQPKHYLIAAVYVSNLLLAIYSVYTCYQFWQWYQMAKDWMKQTGKAFSLKDAAISFSASQHQFIITVTGIILSFFFFMPRIRQSIICTTIVLICFSWDAIWNNIIAPISNSAATSSMPYYAEYMLPFKILNYGCVFIATYSLLWLLKKLPFQKTTQ